jgi:hypothetical protein
MLGKNAPSDKLEEFLRRTGRHVVEFVYMNDITAEEFQLLNLMPNLELLSLKFIYNEIALPPDFRLNLPKLCKLFIESCNFKFVKTLNQLEENVLDELSLENIQGKH